jgi:hypothetical protein
MIVCRRVARTYKLCLEDNPAIRPLVPAHQDKIGWFNNHKLGRAEDFENGFSKSLFIYQNKWENLKAPAEHPPEDQGEEYDGA